MKTGKHLAAVCAALLLWLTAAPVAASTTVSSALLRQDHVKYMNGTGGGLFQPDRAITRGEAAQILYNLLAEQPEAPSPYPDAQESWYSAAIGALWSLGLLREGAGEEFRPADPITRAEFADILSHFLPEGRGGGAFPDVPPSHWAYDAIARAAACGLFTGFEDGTFRPEASLTRAEAAAVLNRLLGRAADTAIIRFSAHIRIFPDVPAEYWAYGDIMEATVDHGHLTQDGRECWTEVVEEKTALADGYYRFGGRLYRVVDGYFLRSVTGDGFSYDESGRYTTGSAAMDSRLSEIVETTAGLAREDALDALFRHVRDSYTYREQEAPREIVGWEADCAERFLRDGGGNSFGAAALYSLLARQLGLPASVVTGRTIFPDSTVLYRAWVEIPLDGAVYWFDPQLAAQLGGDGGGTQTFFRMNPADTGAYAYEP